MSALLICQFESTDIYSLACGYSLKFGNILKGIGG